MGASLIATASRYGNDRMLVSASMRLASLMASSSLRGCRMLTRYCILTDTKIVSGPLAFPVVDSRIFPRKRMSNYCCKIVAAYIEGSSLAVHNL